MLFRTLDMMAEFYLVCINLYPTNPFNPSTHRQSIYLLRNLHIQPHLSTNPSYIVILFGCYLDFIACYLLCFVVTTSRRRRYGRGALRGRRKRGTRQRRHASFFDHTYPMVYKMHWVLLLLCACYFNSRSKRVDWHITLIRLSPIYLTPE